MKIIIPVAGNSEVTRNITGSFHNAEFACVYNCFNHTYEWITTKGMNQKTGDLGKELKHKGITAVISNQMPLMALGFFTDCGLSVYKAESGSIEENIQLFTNNQLMLLTNATAKSTSDCAGSCGSCHTICKS